MRRYVLPWLFSNMSITVKIIYIYICPCIVDSSDINQAQYSWGKKPFTCGSSPSPYPPSFSEPGLVSTGSTQATKFGQPAGASGPPKWLFNNSNCACSFCWTWRFWFFCTKIATQATCFGSKKATNKKVSEIPKGTSVLLSPFLGGVLTLEMDRNYLQCRNFVLQS